jgi:membrane protein YdbS with pleckstrin-like domain
MRPENEWFKPEKLARVLYVYEAIVLTVLLAAIGVVAYFGVLTEAPAVVLAGIAVAVVVPFAYATWWIRAFFDTADYRFTDEEVEYRRGVFFRQKTTVPYDRITNVGTSQGPIERALSAGSVAIHTAGYGGQMGAELTINGVADFEDIKEQVLAKVRRRPPAATESGETSTTVATDDGGEDAMLGELRRIRELLEGERAG